MYDIDLNRYAEVVNSAIGLRRKLKKPSTKSVRRAIPTCFLSAAAAPTPTRCP